MAWYMVYPGKKFCVHLKRMCILLCWTKCSKFVSHPGRSIQVFYILAVFPYSYSNINLVLNSPTISFFQPEFLIVLIFLFVLSDLLNIFGSLMLDVLTFIICYIFLISTLLLLTRVLLSFSLYFFS